MQSCQLDEIGEIVERVQAGDNDSFGLLYSMFRGSIMACLINMGIKYHEAEDLCNDIFLQAHRKITDLREPKKFFAWLKVIAKRMGINFLIRRKCLPSLEELFEPNEISDPSGRLVKLEDVHFARKLLEDLQPMDSQCLRLFYFDGLSLLEIAEILGIPSGTVKRRLHVARKRAKKQKKFAF